MHIHRGLDAVSHTARSACLDRVDFVTCRWAGPQTAGNASDENPAQLLRWKESYEDEAGYLLQEYLRIDTSNPPGDERFAAEFFRSLFTAQEIPSALYDYAPGRDQPLCRLER